MEISLYSWNGIFFLNKYIPVEVYGSFVQQSVILSNELPADALR